MESINVAGVLQETWNADWRVRTRSQVWVEYFVFPYTSMFIGLSHLYQKCHVHCYYKWWGDGIGEKDLFIWGCVCGYLAWDRLIVFGFFLCFGILFVHVLSPFIQVTGAWWLLCLFLFFVCLFVFFLSGPLNQELLVHRNCCVCCVKLFQKSGIWSLFCGFPCSILISFAL